MPVILILETSIYPGLADDGWFQSELFQQLHVITGSLSLLKHEGLMQGICTVYNTNAGTQTLYGWTDGAMTAEARWPITVQ